MIHRLLQVFSIPVLTPIVLLSCSLGLLAQEKPVPPKPAPAEKTPTGLVSNVFVDTDVRQALQDIASQTGAVIVPSEMVGGVVTCELKNVPLDKALEIVLAGTGYVVKKTPDYYLVTAPDPKSPAFPQVAETRLVKLNYSTALVAVKLLSPGFRAYAEPDADSNSVLVTASPDLMKRIVDDLAIIDQPRRHVMLDARIVVLDRNDLLNLGVQWFWPTLQAGAFSTSDTHGVGSTPGGTWPWAIQIGYSPDKQFTNSLLLTLNLLRENDEATILANPKVMAQDGREAEVAVNNEEYFQILTQGTIYVTANLEKISTGTVLKITPRIGDKGDITLDMSTEVSDVIARGQNNLPVVTRRTAKSTVRIEDGGTAVVAGLMDTKSRSNRLAVPGVGGLPIVGAIFRDQADTNTTRQVAVFVTAHLMPEASAPPAPAPPPAPVIKPVGKEFKDALGESLRRLNKEESR